MKNALRNAVLAGAALLAAVPLASSALAGVHFRIDVPLPPPPHLVVAAHRLAPPLHRFLPPRPVRAYVAPRPGHVWVDGRWCEPPYRGAVWVPGHNDPWGRWIPGHWRRAW